MVTQSLIDYLASRTPVGSSDVSPDGVTLLQRRGGGGGFGDFVTHLNMGAWKRG